MTKDTVPDSYTREEIKEYLLSKDVQESHAETFLTMETKSLGGRSADWWIKAGYSVDIMAHFKRVIG